MKHALMLAFSLGLALGMPARAEERAQPRQTPQQAQTQAGERIYGYGLMTWEERAEYNKRMRALKTEEERNAFRLEHHKKMQARAKAQGKTLPATPPEDRPRRGPGYRP